MIKVGFLLGVLVVGVVLVIVGAGGPAEPDKVGGVVPKTAQEEFEQSKGTYRWSLIIGIIVCLLSIGGFVLMVRSCLGGDDAGDQAVAASAEPPSESPPAEPAQEDEDT